jgi:prolipoprotein diacylglyceryltransferase
MLFWISAMSFVVGSQTFLIFILMVFQTTQLLALWIWIWVFVAVFPNGIATVEVSYFGVYCAKRLSVEEYFSHTTRLVSRWSIAQALTRSFIVASAVVSLVVNQVILFHASSSQDWRSFMCLDRTNKEA